MSIIKKSQLALLFSPALALIPGAIATQGNVVSADTTTDTDYTVKLGDTLSQIAQSHNQELSDLANTNSIANQNLILVGQKLKVKTPAPAADTYTVKAGDTLSQIALANNTTVDKLVSDNKLSNADLILVGQNLQLGQTTDTPAAETTQPAAPAANQTPAAPQQQETQQKASTPAATPAATSQSVNTGASTTSYGTFKLSFYDPAVLGSNLGYSGVAANLSVFPKGTHLKITTSDGQVWYRTVNDTGSFAYSNSRQLDVAMPSGQIPSAGILYGTVEVVH